MAAPANTGVFVTFEGGDGAGKSTQIRFLARLLEDAGREVVRLREPGGTAVGEALRAVVLDPAHEAMSDRAELLIYEAARAQIVDEVIRPALGRGAVVLCDRFYDSTAVSYTHLKNSPAGRARRSFLSMDGKTVCAKVDIERILTNSWEVEEAPGGLFSEKFR